MSWHAQKPENETASSCWLILCDSMGTAVQMWVKSAFSDMRQVFCWLLIVGVNVLHYLPKLQHLSFTHVTNFLFVLFSLK